VFYLVIEQLSQQQPTALGPNRQGGQQSEIFLAAFLALLLLLLFF